MWQAFIDVARQRSEERAELAQRMESVGNTLGALWQRLFLGDWESAERLLIGRVRGALDAFPRNLVPDFIETQISSPGRTPFVGALHCLVREREGYAITSMTSELLEILRVPFCGKQSLSALTLAVVQAECAVLFKGKRGSFREIRRVIEMLESWPDDDVQDLAFELADLLVRNEFLDEAWMICQRFTIYGERHEEFRIIETMLRAAMLDSEFDFPPYSIRSMVDTPWRCSSSSAKEYVLEAACWNGIDAGQEQLCVQRYFEDFHRSEGLPHAWISMSASVALVLDGKDQETRFELDCVTGEQLLPCSIEFWVVQLYFLSVGRTGDARRVAEGRAQRNSTGISVIEKSAEAMRAVVSSGNVAAPIEGLSEALSSRVGLSKNRFLGVWGVMNAVLLSRQGHHDASVSVMREVLNVAGRKAVSFGIRLLDRRDTSTLRDAVSRTNKTSILSALLSEPPETQYRPLWLDGRGVRLTRMEMAVLKGVAGGHSLEQLADERYVALTTVRSQWRSVRLKLKMSGKPQSEVVSTARKLGLI